MPPRPSIFPKPNHLAQFLKLVLICLVLLFTSNATVQMFLQIICIVTAAAILKNRKKLLKTLKILISNLGQSSGSVDNEVKLNLD